MKTWTEKELRLAAVDIVARQDGEPPSVIIRSRTKKEV
jgi:hypothetical protein